MSPFEPSRQNRPQPNITYDSVKWRLNPDVPRVTLVETGIPTVDAHLGGGLRKGLMTFYGPAGTGKSEMARAIALSMAQQNNYVLYFTCEVLIDAPIHDNIDRIDYTRYIPNSQRALEELKVWIAELSPSLVVLDSMTSFFSVSRKALPESDLREVIAQLHMETEGTVPVIGISEVRGVGYNEVTAGGMGVEHACTLLAYFEKVVIRYRNDQEAYGLPFGDVAYFMTIEKDKLGLAGTKRRKVNYPSQHTPVLV
jgi:predicted ATP-dependent serine protease